MSITGVKRGASIPIPNSDHNTHVDTKSEPTRKFELRAPTPPKEEPSLLEKVSKNIEKGQTLIDKALSGKTMSSTEILTLQVGAYRAMEQFTLSVKVVEGAVSAVKTVINSEGNGS